MQPTLWVWAAKIGLEIVPLSSRDAPIVELKQVLTPNTGTNERNPPSLLKTCCYSPIVVAHADWSMGYVGRSTKWVELTDTSIPFCGEEPWQPRACWFHNHARMLLAPRTSGILALSSLMFTTTSNTLRAVFWLDGELNQWCTQGSSCDVCMLLVDCSHSNGWMQAFWPKER